MSESSSKDENSLHFLSSLRLHLPLVRNFLSFVFLSHYDSIHSSHSDSYAVTSRSPHPSFAHFVSLFLLLLSLFQGTNSELSTEESEKLLRKLLSEEALSCLKSFANDSAKKEKSITVPLDTSSLSVDEAKGKGKRKRKRLEKERRRKREWK